MDWIRNHFGVSYAPNTRETIRRQTVHQFVEMGIAVPNPDQPDRPVNSPHFGYEIESSALELIQTYGTRRWKKSLASFMESVHTLRVLHHKEREMNRIEVRLPDGSGTSKALRELFRRPRIYHRVPHPESHAQLPQ